MPLKYLELIVPFCNSKQTECPSLFTLLLSCYETVQICSVSPSLFQRWVNYFFCALNIGYDLRPLCASRISLERSQKFFVIKGAIWAQDFFLKPCKMETYFYYFFKVTGFNTELALGFGEDHWTQSPSFFPFSLSSLRHLSCDKAKSMQLNKLI